MQLSKLLETAHRLLFHDLMEGDSIGLFEAVQIILQAQMPCESD